MSGKGIAAAVVGTAAAIGLVGGGGYLAYQAGVGNADTESTSTKKKRARDTGDDATSKDTGSQANANTEKAKEESVAVTAGDAHLVEARDISDSKRTEIAAPFEQYLGNMAAKSGMAVTRVEPHGAQSQGYYMVNTTNGMISVGRAGQVDADKYTRAVSQGVLVMYKSKEGKTGWVDPNDAASNAHRYRDLDSDEPVKTYMLGPSGVVYETMAKPFGESNLGYAWLGEYDNPHSLKSKLAVFSPSQSGELQEQYQRLIKSAL